MKAIGDRISYESKNSTFTMVISARVRGVNEALLAAWILAWGACGAYFIHEYVYGEYGDNAETLKIGLMIMIAFWAYFQFRTTKAFLWKRFGKELIKITPEHFIYKRAVMSYGKAQTLHTPNIKNFGLIKRKDNTFAEVMNSSFWIRGYETMGFDHMEKNVKFGIQLNEDDGTRAAKVINETVRSLRKKAQ
jgi:hypothetical protein